MHRCIILLLMLLLLVPNTFSADLKVWKKGDPVNNLHGFSAGWPKLDPVIVKANITVNSGGYVYSYTIYNPPINKFPLFKVAIDLRDIPSSHPFSFEDLTPQHSPTEHQKIIDVARGVIPIKKLVPPGWNAEQAYGVLPYRDRWASEEDLDKDMVQPGESASGFGWIAKEPPGIREFIADGWDWEWYGRGPDIGEDLKAHGYDPNSPEFYAETNKGIEYLGHTIAPVAPPNPFTQSAWRRRMESDAQEARKLGWIKSDDVLREADGLLTELARAKGKSLGAVVKKLEKFSLEQKKAGGFTDEADALVRLNAEYLLKRLQGQEKKK